MMIMIYSEELTIQKLANSRTKLTNPNIGARLAGSDSPTRIFDAVLEMVSRAKLTKAKRVLDPTSLYGHFSF